MNYLETQRKKAIANRNEIFDDPGMGHFMGKDREFVLQDGDKNLFPPIKDDAIVYFKTYGIQWWKTGNVPPGHLLSSQVACVNHLFPLRKDAEAALAVLQEIDPDFVEACADFEGGFVGFEVVSNESYLNEVKPGNKQTRGANCTSVDATMCGRKIDGTKVQVLIEWKYTEAYSKDCKADGDSGKTRQSRYNALILDAGSPLKSDVPIENFYYEPIYQLMRQTLLAWQMVKHKDQEQGADDYLHVDVIPNANVQLRNKVNAPDLDKTDLHKSWSSLLKKPERYQMIDPQDLLRPLMGNSQHEKHLRYLQRRYWE